MEGEELEELNLQCPGIAFTNADNAPFDLPHDQDMLELKIDLKIGEEKRKAVSYSEDGKKIYVELVDSEDIGKLLSSSIALKKRPPLMMECIDLMDVRRYCLIVKGLEDWLDEEIVKDHFMAEANNERIDSVAVKNGTAVIKFARPKVALKFKSVGESELLGVAVTLEVTEDVSGQEVANQEEMVLSVSNLPLRKIPPKRIIVGLEKYLEKHTGEEVKACVLNGEIAHVTFQDPSVVASIVSNPPQTSFFANTYLKYFTSLKSEVQALCDPPSVDLASSNNSISSVFSQSNYSRNTSMDSTSSIDPNASFSQVRPRNSSTASSSGAISEGHLSTQDSIQEECFMTGPSPTKPQASSDHIMFIQDLEAISSGGDEGYGQSLTTGVSFSIGSGQSATQLASLPNYPIASTPPQRINHKEPSATQDQGYMSMPTLGIGNVVKSGVQSTTSEMMETRVLVGNVPVQKRSDIFISSCLKNLTNISCSVKQYKEQFLAIFQGPVDVQVLKQKSAEKYPLLQFTFIEIQDSRTLIVDGITDTIPPGYLKLHFETATENDSVENVEKLPPNRALITFRNPSYMKKAISSTQCWELEGTTLTMSEYYDFMSLDGVDGDHQPKESVPQQVLNEVQLELKPLEAQWLQITLNEVYDKLNPLKARCVVSEASSSNTKVILISPLDGAESVIDWEAEVKKIVEEHLSNFLEVKFEFSEKLQRDIINRVQQRNDIKLLYKFHECSVLLYGHNNIVNDVISDLKYFVQEIQVDSEERKYSKRQIKLLSLRCQHKLSIDQVEEYELSQDTERIIVKGTVLGRKSFWKTVELEINNLHEKKLTLSPELFYLFHTTKGIRKIEELMGMSISSVVYCLEEDAGNCYIHFLSNSMTDENQLKDIRKRFKNYVGDDVVPVDSNKIRFCRDVKWTKLVERLEKEYFVSIVVDQSSHMVKIAGEKLIVGNIRETLENHLLEISSVEEQFTIDYFKWKIMFADLKYKVEAILQDFGRNLKLLPPNKVDNVQCKPVSITLQGDPNAVDDAKVRLELLAKEVFHLQEKLGDIPVAHRLVARMEDKINNLEHHYGACIDVKFVDENTSSSMPSAVKSKHPAKVGGAILPNEVRVSLYSGNFTKHPNVHTIIIFTSDNPDDADANLKLMFESSNGADLRDEFHTKLNKTVHLSCGSLLKMDNVDGLECNELYYAFVPCWKGGSNHEEYYLEECLLSIQNCLNPSSTVLLTSIGSKPLFYPANVFAKKVLSCFSSLSYALSDITVAIYVNDISDADEFYQLFNNPKTRCRAATLAPQPKTKDSGKTISNPIDSFITLVKGNLLDHQADVYISSTNINLELKNAAVSKALLKASGEELQKECSQYAPLSVGEVAVTNAKNLKCKFIFHVVLPDHSDRCSERVFRTAMQTILRTAKEKSVTSIAIPSLGTGNLHFPASISSKIIYEEIINFNGQNPGLAMKFILVIFDQKDFKEFNKVHAQKMDSHIPKMVPSKGRGSGTQSTMLSVENLDISDEKSDVIVNTTTEDMELSGSAVSKALLQKAGTSLQRACSQMVQDGFRLDHGQIVVTKSFGSLKCQKIIHAHVPPRSDAVKMSIDHFALIHDIVLKCLVKTEQLKMKSISFPAFGFGQGGYSVDEVAHPMLTAIQEFGSEPHQTVEKIRIVIFDPAMHKEFYDLYVSFFNVSGSFSSKILNSITSMVTGEHQGRCVDLQASSNRGVLPTSKITTSHSNPYSTIIFNVYASSEKKCKDIADQLRQFIRDLYKVEPIVNPIIRSLIDTDVQEISRVEKDCQVSIKIVREIKQITVQGEMSEVWDAKGRINEMLNKIEKEVQFELQQHEWYTSGDGDSDKEEYQTEHSFMLERAYQCGISAIELVIDNMEVVVDLKSNPMQERSKDTGVVRIVKREKKKPPIDLPVTWEKQPIIDGKPAEVYRFEVKEGTPEYRDALKRFHETIRMQVTIEKLERIQNPNLYNLHVTLRDAIASKYNKNTVEVKQLFHGLKESTVNDVMTTGFNRSFAATANAAYYGVGVYFALNASYSAQAKYSVPNKDKVQFVFICSVIIGKYTKGSQGMKAPPPLEQGKSLLYDTLVENENNPTIFVAVKDNQAYPDYLVSFKKK